MHYIVDDLLIAPVFCLKFREKTNALTKNLSIEKVYHYGKYEKVTFNKDALTKNIMALLKHLYSSN